MDYNLPKGRVWVLLLAWLFFLPYVVMVFFGVGCLENTERQTAREWRAVSPEDKFYDREPLLIQVSRDPVVYMSHISEAPDRTDSDEENEVVVMPANVVMPSNLDDVLTRLMRHQAMQEAMKKPVSILLTGDDLADCGSVIRVIDDARHLGIEWIFFETAYCRTGDVGFCVGGIDLEVGGDFSLRHFDFSKETKNNSGNPEWVVSIVLRQDDAILWGSTPVSLGDFVGKLEDLRRRVKWVEDLRVTVHVDAKAGFAPLRYVLDLLKRAGISKVMLKPL